MNELEFKNAFLLMIPNQDNRYHLLVWINGEPEFGENIYIGGVSEIYAKGARVVIAEINGPALKNILSELSRSKKNKITGIKTDISNIKQVKHLINSTVTKYGTIDVLVNIAGLQKPIGRLTEVKETDWIKNIHTNIIGTMLCCKYVLPVMISKKKGKIINFSGRLESYSNHFFHISKFFFF